MKTLGHRQLTFKSCCYSLTREYAAQSPTFLICRKLIEIHFENSRY